MSLQGVFGGEQQSRAELLAAGLCSCLFRWFYKMRWRRMTAIAPCLVSLTLTVDSWSRRVRPQLTAFWDRWWQACARITRRHNALLFILKQLLDQLRIQQNIRDPPSNKCQVIFLLYIAEAHTKVVSECISFKWMITGTRCHHNMFSILITIYTGNSSFVFYHLSNKQLKHEETREIIRFKKNLFTLAKVSVPLNSTAWWGKCSFIKL